MLRLVRFYVTICFFLCACIANAQNVVLEKTGSFFPPSDKLKGQQIEWSFLTVPENWNQKESKSIKIAVCVLKATAKQATAEPVVYFQGGPGASGIQNLGTWLNHPLRRQHDIVLVDIRGTGFSEPRLCPDLGKEFFNILAKNQAAAKDEQQKAAAALACRQELIGKGVDIAAYTSSSVASDINALKKKLGYTKWHVYGVSYGTYMAQVYANTFPNDVQSLLLDSSVSDIESYYTKNTSNYIHSLAKVFALCQANPVANKQYPELEKVYYKTIQELQQAPLTVAVDTSLVASGTFTYNAEDFKVAIQQALYHKQLIEMVPLLIYQFHNRNEKGLSNLVEAFSSLLAMDYGVYYCVSCNEVLPNNSMPAYLKDAAQYKKLAGGLSFYQSDFTVCKGWNANRGTQAAAPYDLSNLAKASFPVLVFAGGFDPITPFTNGKAVASKLPNATYIYAPTYGHIPSFTKIGDEVAEAFVDRPAQKPNVAAFTTVQQVDFVTDVTINGGISKLGKSVNSLEPMFFLPLLIAFGVLCAFIFSFLIKSIKKRYENMHDQIMRGLIALTASVGIAVLVGLIVALMQVVKQNYFVLAFGLPSQFEYLFTMIVVFLALLVVTFGYFVVQIRKIHDKSVVLSAIFSKSLIVFYLLYWGIL